MLKVHKCFAAILLAFFLFSFFFQSQMATCAHAGNKIFALVEACRKGELETVKRLISEGLNANSMFSGGEPPLLVAAGMGHLEIVQFLHEKGADVNSRDYRNSTPLIEAAGGGHLKVVEFLISQGAEINVRDRRNVTPLIRTAGGGYFKIVEILINRGADINARNIRGESALIDASSQGRLEVVKLLLEKGANARLEDQYRQSAFLYACRLGHLAIAKLLLEHDPGIRPQHDQLNDAFTDLCARKSKSNEMLDFMLKLGVDINARGKKEEGGRTGLIKASAAGRIETVRFLLKKGAKVNATDNYGNTASILAAKRGKMEVLRVLVEHAANLEQKNFSGETALMLAKDEEVARLIKSYGAKAPVLLTPENFDLYHSLPYDKRLSKGLELSFRQYYRLFTRRPGALISVKTASTKLDLDHYKIAYEVNIQGVRETYAVILSNQARDVHKNLVALRKVLFDFSGSRQNIHRKFTKKQSDYDGLQDELAELIYHFDYTDLFEALQLIDHHLISGKSGPKALLSAAEIYSWLAFFKNRNQNRHLSDTLATYAICNYLLGSLQKIPEESGSLNEGLLLLSLDYPKAALESFNKDSDLEQLMTAYIRYDFETFTSLRRNPLINKRLLSYLEARAYNSSNQRNVARSHFETLTLNYPGFLMAKEYVLDNAGVGFSRRLIQPYFEELLERHLDILDKLAQTEWIKHGKELEVLVRKEVSEANRLSKWLKIHKAMVNGTSVLKVFSSVIEADFLKHFLLEDVANALVIYHNLESERLARKAETAAIVELIETVYPESTLSRVVLLKQSQDRNRISQILKSAKMKSENRYFIRTAIETGAASPRERIELLNGYREKENPDSMGLYRMYELHYELFYRSVAVRCLKEGVAANPYNYLFYEKAFDTKDGRLYIKQGKKHAGELYGFLTALGAWYHKNGNKKEAVSSYEAAINKSPGQQSAYMKLGEIYSHEKQHQKAIETWKAYLKYDDQTLSAVKIKSAIGQTWLEMDESSKAYDIFMESKKSWQAGSLLGFAEASEKTGRILQAEEYFNRAAKRYPSGKCPHSLGLFYLRQKNIDMACQVFREYKRYQSEYNYIYYLADHFIKTGSPGEAKEVIKKVEGESSEKLPTCLIVLARAYASKELYESAMLLIKPFLFREEFHWLIAEYIEYSKAGKIGDSDKLLSKVKNRNISKPYFDWNLANSCMRRGLFEEALPLLMDVLGKDKRQIQNSIRKMALMNAAVAWRMGNGDRNTKEEIRSHVNDFQKDPWITSCVLFLINDIDEKTIFFRAGTQKQYSEIYYYLGIIKNEQDERNEALKHLLIYLETMNENHIPYRHAYRLASQIAQ